MLVAFAPCATSAFATPLVRVHPLLHITAARPVRYHAATLSSGDGIPAAPDDGADKSDARKEETLADLLFQPGSEYEIDEEELNDLIDLYDAAELRWRDVGGNIKKVGVLDDPGSMIHKWWNDPFDGPRAQSERLRRNIEVKRKVNRVVRPACVVAGLGVGLAMPSRVAAFSLRWGITLHIGLPFARLAFAKAAAPRRRRRGSQLAADGSGGASQRANGADINDINIAAASDQSIAHLRLADPTHILAAQHLLGACSVFPIGAMLWLGGGWFEALAVASIGRLSLVTGLWCWKDLGSDLIRPGGTRRSIQLLCAVSRLWRLVTTFTLLAEAAMLARLACALDALWVARPSLFAAASGAAAVIPSLVSKPLSSAASLTLARGGALGLGWWSKLGWLPSVPQTTLLLGGRLGVVLLLCYTAYWFAFPLEVGGRFMWSSSLSPKQEHVNTLSARLLRGLKIVRPDFKVVELLRRRDLLINGGRGMGSIRASGGAVGASAETASVRQRAGDDSRLMLWHASADDFVQDEESGGGVFSSDLGQLGSEEDMMGLAAQQEDNRWAFMELGRLFFAEDATGRAAAAGIKEDNIKRIPPEMRWSRDESETTVRAMFEDRTKFLGNQSDEVLAETLMLKFALEAWNEDQPDDYEPSRIEPTPMTEELQRAEERMRKAAGREPGGGGFALLDAERSAEDAQAMVASEVTGDEGLEGLGLAAEAAPETVRVAEDDDDDEDGQDGGSVLFV